MTATSEEQRQSADWDIRSSASNYLTLIMAQAVASLGAFATVWVATRLLGAEGYGRVAAVIAATQLVIQVALNWTAHAVTRFGCEEFVKTKKISKSFWTRLMILAPNLLLILLTSDLWLPHLAKWLKIHSAAQPLVLVYIVVNVFWLHIQHTLQGVKLQRVQAILMASERLLSFVVLTVFILSRSLSSLTMILAYITGAVAVSLIGLWQLRSLIFPLLGLDRELFSAILKFSLPLLP
ncbi:MAG TPA: oligosaccharide flippase family protein, partial [Blastocatellia bacterium]|nr:oligosaccharide flippase family protein [Blastocatellia bacterium]